MDALSSAKAVAEPVQDVGRRFMVHRDTFAMAPRAGLEPGIGFYALGRLGVLGAAQPDLVAAAAAVFEPGVVAAMWDAGIASCPDPRVAAVHYARACAAWASSHLAELSGDDAAELASLAATVVDRASPLNAPIFVGWRALERPENPVERAYLLVHVLRELRFARHVVAIQVSDMTPLETILTGPGGERNAETLGWSPPFPDVTARAATRAEVEALTDELSARDMATLDDADRARLVELVDTVRGLLG